MATLEENRKNMKLTDFELLDTLGNNTFLLTIALYFLKYWI